MLSQWKHLESFKYSYREIKKIAYLFHQIKIFAFRVQPFCYK